METVRQRKKKKDAEGTNEEAEMTRSCVHVQYAPVFPGAIHWVGEGGTNAKRKARIWRHRKQEHGQPSLVLAAQTFAGLFAFKIKGKMGSYLTIWWTK